MDPPASRSCRSCGRPTASRCSSCRTRARICGMSRAGAAPSPISRRVCAVPCTGSSTARRSCRRRQIRPHAASARLRAMSTRPPKASYDLVLLPGDGIGVEVISDARALIEAIAHKLGVTFTLTDIPCGGKYFLDHGRDWSVGCEVCCLAVDAILLGAVGWNGPDGQPVAMPDGKMAGCNPVIGTRMRLDLYANIRPVRCLPA